MNLRHSISGKLTRINMLVCATALVIACVALTLYEQYAVRQAIVTNLSTQASIIGSNTISALTFNDPDAAQSTLSALQGVPYVVSAGILTPDGKVFAQYSRDGAQSYLNLRSVPSGKSEVYSSANGHVLIVQSIVFQGKTIGAVYLERNLDVLYDRMKRYIAITLAVLLISLATAFVVSRRVSRSVSGPVVKLADVASSVSRTRDYSVRAEPTKETDEVSLLIESFNNMLREIQRRDSELQQAREQLEHKVEQRTTQLVAANRELEAFAYSVSHDLRAPLETINGFSHVLRTALGERIGDSEKAYLQHIQLAARRMAELIDDLLNLSRVSTTEMHKVKVDLGGMARETAAQLSATEPQRKVQFVIGECQQANGDPRLVQLVIDNLLRNAWKYTSSVPEAIIELGCTVEKDRVVYFVRDNGAGFDPQLTGRLFKPFQRLHSSAEFPGTGIGLATVHRVVQKHGGEVWAEGSVGKGATFYFTLAPTISTVAV